MCPLLASLLFFFIDPILSTLLLLKYQTDGESIFESHPINPKVAIATLLVYCLAHGAQLSFMTSTSTNSTYVCVLCTTMMLFASLSLASMGSLLFFNVAQFIAYTLHTLISLANLCGLISSVCKQIHCKLNSQWDKMRSTMALRGSTYPLFP